MGKHTARPRALVTGSSGGIGEAVAYRLADRGFAVAVHGRREDQVARVVSEIQRRGAFAAAVIGDLAAEGVPESVARQAAEVLGGIDVLVNNAGVVVLGAIEESPPEELRRLFEINFFATTLLTRALLPAMRERQSGRVINVTSTVGWLPTPYLGIYSASKHALEAYSEVLDHEVRQWGIRVCTVQPGFTKTAIGRQDADASKPLAEYSSRRQRAVGWIRNQIERGVHPDKVARVIERAATARNPKRHYRVGAQAHVYRLLRSVVPSPLFHWGLRQQLGLDR